MPEAELLNSASKTLAEKPAATEKPGQPSLDAFKGTDKKDRRENEDHWYKNHSIKAPLEVGQGYKRW